MPSAEVAPTPTYEAPETRSERTPQFSIPGFETLPPESQRLYLKIPPEHLEASRRVIEEQIRKHRQGAEVVSGGQADQQRAANLETSARSRESQANDAVDTWHRAAAGDAEAAKDLMDAKKELLGEEPKDEEIWEVVFENHSSNIFASDQEADEWLELYQQLRNQEVFDLFKEFRGDVPSADDVLKPKLQLALFDKLTEHRTGFPEKLHHLRQVLKAITRDGATGLREAVAQWNLVGDNMVLEQNVDALTRRLSQTGGEGGSAEEAPDVPRPVEDTQHEDAAGNLSVKDHIVPDRKTANDSGKLGTFPPHAGAVGK